MPFSLKGQDAIIFEGSKELSVYGHAHNDYEHEQPLMDALKAGFRSIEVDIHFRRGQLKVSHGRSKLKKKKTIDQLYLAPLDSLYNNGLLDNFISGSEQITLMVDLKTRKKKLLVHLDRLLHKYDHLLHKRLPNGQDQWGPVVILISGNPPIKKWQKVQSPHFHLDGRIKSNYPTDIATQVTRISASLGSLISEKHLLNPECTQYKRFRALVKKLYSKSVKEVRFWASSDKVEVWDALVEAGVNVVSVDNLEKFEKYLKSK